MKKIEAVIKRKNFPIIKTSLNTVGTYIIDKRNLDDSHIYDETKGASAGSTNLKSIPLAKIEMVVSDKDARKVVEMISKNSGLSSNHGGKIFVSEMAEVVDMNSLEGDQDLENSHKEIRNCICNHFLCIGLGQHSWFVQPLPWSM